MSKDGDWIVREDEEALDHVLEVLARHGSHYRFGAPMDRRWLAFGWSSHLEAALDRERRELMHRNERRLAAYESAAATWRSRWTTVNEQLREARDLGTAHRLLVREAERACRSRLERSRE